VPHRADGSEVGDKYEWRDVVMPGIYELRTTAQRTGEYLGHAKPEYGDMVGSAGVKAPEWCSFTVYRWNPSRIKASSRWCSSRSRRHETRRQRERALVEGADADADEVRRSRRAARSVPR
jgi:hypothetical protein